MIVRIRRWRSFLKRSLLFLVMFALVTACQSSVIQNPPRSSEPSVSMGESSGSCRMVPHEMGETKICGQPQRIAALSPHMLDSMLALGVQPIAYAEINALNLEKFNQPSEQIPYLGDRVTTQPVNLGARESPSLEKLMVVKPDLILGESWSHKDKYQLLNRIAPTLLFSDIKGNKQVWTHDIQAIAKALGREHQAEQLLTEYPQRLAKVRSQLQPVVAAYPNVLLLAVNTLMNDVAIAADSTAGRLLEEVGFHLVFPKVVPAGETRWLQTSLEVLPTLSADIVMVIAWDFSNPYNPQEQLKAKWEQTPLLRNIPAAQAGRVFFVDYQLWGSVTRGPITDELILKKLSEFLLPLL